VLSLNKPYICVRTEKYKPMGWLGMMLGTKLYHTCVALEDVDLCAQNVAKELGERGKNAIIVKAEDVKVNGKMISK
jgi:hypothetical protein